MAIPKLTPAERDDALRTLDGWRHDAARDGLARSFRFGGFAEAFAFMTRVAILAEKADHHPEWSNLYDRVDVLLTTHDAGGLSARDVALARAIDGFAQPGSE